VKQSDGKLLVGGLFTSYNGTTVNHLCRLNTDGTLDASFDIGTGFNNPVYSIALLPNGKILAGGGFTSFNGVARNYIVCLNGDGSFNSNFNLGSGFDWIVHQIVVQTDGKILVGGRFGTFNGRSRSGIARLNSDGYLDYSFNPGTGFNNYITHCSVSRRVQI
jgi:uncharacterized delta-60 repeat protein